MTSPEAGNLAQKISSVSSDAQFLQSFYRLGDVGSPKKVAAGTPFLTEFLEREDCKHHQGEALFGKSEESNLKNHQFCEQNDSTSKL